METMTLATTDLIPKIPIRIQITGHRAFFVRNRIALRVLRIGAFVTCLIGKNLHIEINV